LFVVMALLGLVAAVPPAAASPGQSQGLADPWDLGVPATEDPVTVRSFELGGAAVSDPATEEHCAVLADGTSASLELVVTAVEICFADQSVRDRYLLDNGIEWSLHLDEVITPGSSRAIRSSSPSTSPNRGSAVPVPRWWGWTVSVVV
jgi:hypothetical protein